MRRKAADHELVLTPDDMTAMVVLVANADPTKINISTPMGQRMVGLIGRCAEVGEHERTRISVLKAD